MRVLVEAPVTVACAAYVHDASASSSSSSATVLAITARDDTAQLSVHHTHSDSGLVVPGMSARVHTDARTCVVDAAMNDAGVVACWLYNKSNSNKDDDDATRPQSRVAFYARSGQHVATAVLPSSSDSSSSSSTTMTHVATDAHARREWQTRFAMQHVRAAMTTAAATSNHHGDARSNNNNGDDAECSAVVDVAVVMTAPPSQCALCVCARHGERAEARLLRLATSDHTTSAADTTTTTTTTAIACVGAGRAGRAEVTVVLCDGRVVLCGLRDNDKDDDDGDDDSSSDDDSDRGMPHRTSTSTTSSSSSSTATRASTAGEWVVWESSEGSRNGGATTTAPAPLRNNNNNSMHACTTVQQQQQARRTEARVSQTLQRFVPLATLQLPCTLRATTCRSDRDDDDDATTNAADVLDASRVCRVAWSGRRVLWLVCDDGSVVVLRLARRDHHAAAAAASEHTHATTAAAAATHMRDDEEEQQRQPSSPPPQTTATTPARPVRALCVVHVCRLPCWPVTQPSTLHVYATAQPCALHVCYRYDDDDHIATAAAVAFAHDNERDERTRLPWSSSSLLCYGTLRVSAAATRTRRRQHIVAAMHSTLRCYAVDVAADVLHTDGDAASMTVHGVHFAGGRYRALVSAPQRGVCDVRLPSDRAHVLAAHNSTDKNTNGNNDNDNDAAATRAGVTSALPTPLDVMRADAEQLLQYCQTCDAALRDDAAWRLHARRHNDDEDAHDRRGNGAVRRHVTAMRARWRDVCDVVHALRRRERQGARERAALLLSLHTNNNNDNNNDDAHDMYTRRTHADGATAVAAVLPRALSYPHQLWRRLQCRRRLVDVYTLLARLLHDDDDNTSNSTDRDDDESTLSSYLHAPLDACLALAATRRRARAAQLTRWRRCAHGYPALAAAADAADADDDIVNGDGVATRTRHGHDAIATATAAAAAAAPLCFDVLLAAAAMTTRTAHDTLRTTTCTLNDVLTRARAMTPGLALLVLYVTYDGSRRRRRRRRCGSDDGGSARDTATSTAPYGTATTTRDKDDDNDDNEEAAAAAANAVDAQTRSAGRHGDDGDEDDGGRVLRRAFLRAFALPCALDTLARLAYDVDHAHDGDGDANTTTTTTKTTTTTACCAADVCTVLRTLHDVLPDVATCTTTTTSDAVTDAASTSLLLSRLVCGLVYAGADRVVMQCLPTLLSLRSTHTTTTAVLLRPRLLSLLLYVALRAHAHDTVAMLHDAIASVAVAAAATAADVALSRRCAHGASLTACALAYAALQGGDVRALLRSRVTCDRAHTSSMTTTTPAAMFEHVLCAHTSWPRCDVVRLQFHVHMRRYDEARDGCAAMVARARGAAAQQHCQAVAALLTRLLPSHMRSAMTHTDGRNDDNNDDDYDNDTAAATATARAQMLLCASNDDNSYNNSGSHHRNLLACDLTRLQTRLRRVAACEHNGGADTIAAADAAHTRHGTRGAAVADDNNDNEESSDDDDARWQPSTIAQSLVRASTATRTSSSSSSPTMTRCSAEADENAA